MPRPNPARWVANVFYDDGRFARQDVTTMMHRLIAEWGGVECAMQAAEQAVAEHLMLLCTVEVEQETQ